MIRQLENQSEVTPILQSDLHGSAVTGAFWNVALALANKVTTLLGQLALAWFLVPADVGLANTALAMSVIGTILSVGGLGNVLLQRGRYREEAAQAYWLSFGFCFLMALIVATLALLSPLLGRPEMRKLLFVVAFATLISFPATILSAGLKIKLDFKWLAISQFLGGLTYTSIAVLLAKFGWGALALLIPAIPSQMVTMAVMATRGSIPRFTLPKWENLRILAKPTLSLSFSGLFSGLQSQAPIFICGLILSPAGTGYFSWGWSVAGQAVFLLAINLREVLLPVFIQMANDTHHRAEKALKAARVITALLCIACGTQALLARPMVAILVPEKWLLAVPVLIIASLGLVLQGVWISGTAWLNACGLYHTLLKLSILQAGLNAVFTWIGAHWAGPTGAAAGYALACLLGSVASVVPMGRKILHDMMKSWWKPLSFSFVVWIGCMFASYGRGLPTEASSAVIFASLATWIWWREDDGNLANTLRKLRNIIFRNQINASNLSKYND